MKNNFPLHSHDNVLGAVWVGFEPHREHDGPGGAGEFNLQQADSR